MSFRLPVIMDPSLIFDQFAQASTFRAIQQTFFQLCTSMNIEASNASEVYEKYFFIFTYHFCFVHILIGLLRKIFKLWLYTLIKLLESVNWTKVNHTQRPTNYGRFSISVEISSSIAHKRPAIVSIF